MKTRDFKKKFAHHFATTYPLCYSKGLLDIHFGEPNHHTGTPIKPIVFLDELAKNVFIEGEHTVTAFLKFRENEKPIFVDTSDGSRVAVYAQPIEAFLTKELREAIERDWLKTSREDDLIPDIWRKVYEPSLIFNKGLRYGINSYNDSIIRAVNKMFPFRPCQPVTFHGAKLTWNYISTQEAEKKLDEVGKSSFIKEHQGDFELRLSPGYSRKTGELPKKTDGFIHGSLRQDEPIKPVQTNDIPSYNLIGKSATYMIIDDPFQETALDHKSSLTDWLSVNCPPKPPLESGQVHYKVSEQEMTAALRPTIAELGNVTAEKVKKIAGKYSVDNDPKENDTRIFRGYDPASSNGDIAVTVVFEIGRDNVARIISVENHIQKNYRLMKEFRNVKGANHHHNSDCFARLMRQLTAEKILSKI